MLLLVAIPTPESSSPACCVSVVSSVPWCSSLGNGVLCIGREGRCEGDVGSLLPQGWSVLAIDVQRGCIRLARSGEPQAPLCMA